MDKALARRAGFGYDIEKWSGRSEMGAASAG